MDKNDARIDFGLWEQELADVSELYDDVFAAAAFKSALEISDAMVPKCILCDQHHTLKEHLDTEWPSFGE